MANLLPVPVLLAIFGAAVALALPRRPATQRAVSVLSLSGIVAVAAVACFSRLPSTGRRLGARKLAA